MADIQTANVLRELVEDGQRTGTWDYVHGEWSFEDAQTHIHYLDQGIVRSMTHLDEETVSLFGQELSLGPVATVFHSPRLVNEENVRAALTAPQRPDTVEVILNPHETNVVTVRYRLFEEFLERVSQGVEPPLGFDWFTPGSGEAE